MTVPIQNRIEIASLHFDMGDPDMDRLLKPSRFYRRPADVVADSSLSISEKRSILSSWASDACAVESMPALRKWPGSSEPVAFDEVMEALQSLDSKVQQSVVHRWARESPLKIAS